MIRPFKIELPVHGCCAMLFDAATPAAARGSWERAKSDSKLALEADGGEPSLEDEMSRLLGDLSDTKRA